MKQSEKKKWVLLFFGLCVVTLVMGATPLTNPILKFLDGIKFAIDGTTIWEMMLIRYGVKKIQHGILNKETSSYEGMYLFQGVYHSLRSLAELECAFQEERAQKKNQLEQQFIDDQARIACLEELSTMTTMLEEKFQQDCQEQLPVLERTLEQDEAIVHDQILLQETLYRSYQHEIQHQEDLIMQKYIINKEAYHDAHMRVQQEYEGIEKELATAFARIKHDVLNVLAPFKKKMALAKKFLQQLVEEFCRKRKRHTSFLMHWTMIADGQEFVIFNKTMTNCKTLDAFCYDLTGFLKDIIESCPKGWQQFLELSKPKKNEF